MPLPPLSLLASAVAGLSFRPEGVALIAPGGDDPCDAMLPRVMDVSKSHGYSVSTSAFGFIGARGETELDARCSAGHLEIALLEANGSGVSVTFRRRAGKSFTLEFLGEFPEVGTVSRTAIIDASADPMMGSLIFAAEAGGGSIFVQLDLGGKVLAASGAAPGEDTNRINTVLAPVLSASEVWKDIHLLTYAAAGIWDSDMAAHESELDMLLGLAIPSPDPVAKVDSDGKDAVQKCGVATAICIAAAWLPPGGAWACGVALGTCFAALPCLPADCAGDGV